MDAATQLRRDEGCIPTPYRDSRGYWTVGIGRRLNRPFSQAAIELLFREDLQTAYATAERVAGYHDMTEPRQAVLVNMAFNLGGAGLRTFEQMLGAIARRDYARAAAEIRDSLLASQVGARAERLARQMESGEWVS